jgi:hypothetical protein
MYDNKDNIKPTINQTLSKIILPIGLKKGIGKLLGNFQSANENINNPT